MHKDNCNLAQKILGKGRGIVHTGTHAAEHGVRWKTIHNNFTIFSVHAVTTRIMGRTKAWAPRKTATHLTNHFIDFLIGELLAQVGHDVSEFSGTDETITVLVKNLVKKTTYEARWKTFHKYRRHNLNCSKSQN